MPDNPTTGQHIYNRRFDPQGQDSLAKIARWIRPGSVVLDLGTGPGVLAQHLSEERACIVDGVEIDPASAEAGQRYFRQLQVVDLEDADLEHLFTGSRYDYIICADILEHLRQPLDLLRKLPVLLAKHGRIVLSVPNVGHLGLIAELIRGEFRYRDEGLLDNTHLRFFTRASLLRLLEEAGLALRDFDTVELDLAASEFDAQQFAALPAALREVLETKPDALTYQFLAEVVPRTVEAAPPLVKVPCSPNSGDKDKALQLSAQVTDLEQSRQQQTAEFQQQIAALQNQTLADQHELEALRSDREILRRELDVIFASLSWKVTRPLRATARFLRRVRFHWLG